ncbi:MAG TPA: acylphosphatase [Methylomirabilota bacterium]|nr:acylphosphatase [Methylomirabilota bacterium]
MRAPSDKVRVYLRIEGRVQGVYFRASTVAQAQKIKVTGWVRNSPDGSVEVVAEGGQAEIEQLIAWCRDGPPGAHVTFVEVRYESLQDEFPGFSIKR